MIDGVHFINDFRPVDVMYNGKKIAGWEEATATGQNVTADNTYNDAAHVEVQGNTELQSDYMECWGGSVQKKLDGVNLFDRSYALEHNALIWVQGIPFPEAISITSDYIHVQEGESYSVNYQVQVMFYDAAKNYLGCLLNNSIVNVQGGYYSNFTVPVGASASFVRLGFRAYETSKVNPNVADFNTVTDIFVTTATNASHTYEPYCGGKPSPNPDYPQAITPLVTAGTYKITTDYGIYEVAIPDLHGIGDVTDKVVFDAVSGKGYLLQKTESINLTGNESFTVQGTGVNDYGIISYPATIYDEISETTITKPALSSILPWRSEGLYDAQQPGFMVQTGLGSTRLYLRVLAADYPDAQSIKTKLAELATAGTPARIVYQLVTPIRTPLAFTKVETSTAEELPRKAFGKNLLLTTPQKVIMEGVTWNVGGDGHITASGTATGYSAILLTRNLILPAGTYTFSLNDTPVNVAISASSHSGLEGMSFPVTVTFSELTTMSFGLKRYSNKETMFDGYIQIEKSDTVTAYEPFNPTPPTSNTPSIDYPQTIVPASGTLTTSCGNKQFTQQIPPLYGIKNTDGTWAARDKLVIDDASKSAWIERNIGVKAYTGRESFTDYLEKYQCVTATLYPKPKTMLLCSHGQYPADVGWANDNDIAFIAENFSVTSIKEWRAYLAEQHAAGTPLTVAYCLRESTAAPIEYHAAKTYYPQTVIELSSNLPMDMTTKYKHF